MKVCYLVNQYPKISHTFIRREILALESLGAEVSRVSVRQVQEKIIDPADQAEFAKTHFIISSSKIHSALNLVVAFLMALPQISKALPVLLKLMSNAGGNRLRHIIYLMEACWLLRFCRDRDVEHLHTHFGTNSTTVALLCRSLGGPAYSFTLHGPEEFDFPVALSLKEKIRAAKFVVAITSYCKSQLYRWADFSDWSKIVEVHCAIDEQILTLPSSTVANPKRLVSIGRLCEQKGQMLLLQAINRLKVSHPDIELHLVGDGEFRDLFENYIRENQLSKNIFIRGWMTGNAIFAELDAACVMVLPSFAEGLPVVIMESFARKRPVLTTFIAGIPELVTPENGWLVPAGNVDALVEAIERVLNTSPEKLSAMGLNGFEAVSVRHNAPIEAKKLYQFMGCENVG